MKRFIAILRKLGIFRSGSVSGTYTSAKNRPTEMMMDNVYDAEKDLIKINKNNSKQNTQDQKFSPKGTVAIFWIALVVSIILILMMLLSSGFSIWLIISAILWMSFEFWLKKISIVQTALWKVILLFVTVFILTFILFVVAIPSQNSNGGSSSTSDNNKKTSSNLGEVVTAKEAYPELLKTAQNEWSQDAVLILLEASTNVHNLKVKIENGKSNFWQAVLYSPSQKTIHYYNFIDGKISKGPEEQVNNDVPYLRITSFIDSPVIYEKAKAAGIEKIEYMKLVSGDVPHYNFFSNGKKPLETFWLVTDDTGTKIYKFDIVTGEKIEKYEFIQ